MHFPNPKVIGDGKLFLYLMNLKQAYCYLCDITCEKAQDNFDEILVEALGIQTNMIAHFKALICGSLEPKKLSTRPPNEATMPS